MARSQSNFRLSPEILDKIDRIGERHHGLDRTKVVVAAVTLLYEREFAAPAGGPKKTSRKSESVS